MNRPATGDPLRLTVRIANVGAAWPGSAEQPLEVAAAWDGPPGRGARAGLLGLTTLGPAPFVTVTLDLTPPPAGLDAAHSLHVAVNPGFSIAETDAGNNIQIITAGGIAAPWVCGHRWRRVARSTSWAGTRWRIAGWRAIASIARRTAASGSRWVAASRPATWT